MKNLLFVGALALSCACLSGEQANAWINSNFGMGLNWSWQSGGNSALWGLFRDGQPGAPEVCHTLQSVAMPTTNVPCTPAPTPCPIGGFAPNLNVAPGAYAPAVVVPAAPPVAVAPANSSTQSMYRPYNAYRPVPYNYYQPRR